MILDGIKLSMEISNLYRFDGSFGKYDLDVKLDVSNLDDDDELIDDVCKNVYDMIMDLLKKNEDSNLIQMIQVDVVENDREWSFVVDNEHKETVYEGRPGEFIYDSVWGIYGTLG